MEGINNSNISSQDFNYTVGSTGDITPLNIKPSEEAEEVGKTFVNAMTEEMSFKSQNFHDNFYRILDMFEYKKLNIFRRAVDFFVSLLDISDKYADVQIILRQNGLNLEREQILDIEYNKSDDTTRVYLTNGSRIDINSSGTIDYIKVEIDSTFNQYISIDFDEKGEVHYIIYNNGSEFVSITNFYDDLNTIFNEFGFNFSNIIYGDDSDLTFSFNDEYYRVDLSSDAMSIYKLSNDFKNKEIIGFVKDGKVIKRNADDIVSIFDDYSLATDQYGGSQMAFLYDVDSMLQDEYIINSIMKTWPNLNAYPEGIRMEIIESYLNKICNVGCGYIAMVNTIFKEFEGREEEFQNIFGFPMYFTNTSGIVDFNYEYLTLDYFNYIWHSYSDSLIDISGYSGYSSIKVHGATTYDLDKFKKFLQEKYNIDVNVDYTHIEKEDLFDIISRSEDIQYVFEGWNFDLYDVDTHELIFENVSGHYMSITGITDNGEIIVSSWGKRYILGIDSVSRPGLVKVKY